MIVRSVSPLARTRGGRAKTVIGSFGEKAPWEVNGINQSGGSGTYLPLQFAYLLKYSPFYNHLPGLPFALSDRVLCRPSRLVQQMAEDTDGCILVAWQECM